MKIKLKPNNQDPQSSQMGNVKVTTCFELLTTAAAHLRESADIAILDTI